jgi:hypothetical protein
MTADRLSSVGAVVRRARQDVEAILKEGGERML